MKTIVFIIDQVYMHGGIERVLSVKANYLASLSNYNITIITTEQKNKVSCYNFHEAISFVDISINYHRNKSYFHPKNLLKLPKHIFKLKKEFRKIKPDVIVVCSHSTDTYFLPFISKHIPKVKEYHYSKYIEEPIRNNNRKSFKKYFLNFSDFVNTKYDNIITLNKTEASHYTSKNVITIPNPLTFYPKHVSTLDHKIVIAVGRIATVKGYDQLIDIWEKVNLSKPNWKLYIYGEGDFDYTKTLQKKIVDKGLKDIIKLKGSVTNVEKELLKASIFVMTSINECFPLVLLEAQSCGLPIISYDCPYGPRNIIDKNTGILIPVANQQQFSNAILKIIEDRDLRISMGKNARINSIKYQVSNIMEQWDAMFNNLISN